MKLSLVNINGSGHKFRSANLGFTLIELVIVVVIIAIGVALAVPSYENIVQKRQVTSGAEQIASFLGIAQTEAMKRNEVIAVSIKRVVNGTTWCVGAVIKTTGVDHCECDKPATSSADSNYCDFSSDGASAVQLVDQAGFRSFTMSNSTPNNDFNFNFDPIRGVKILDNGSIDASAHNITLLSSNTNYSLRVGVSVTGRIRVCNPDTSKKVPGYSNCT